MLWFSRLLLLWKPEQFIAYRLPIMNILLKSLQSVKTLIINNPYFRFFNLSFVCFGFIFLFILLHFSRFCFVLLFIVIFYLIQRRTSLIVLFYH